MKEFWVLILVAFFATNSFDKAESVQLEEIDEIFGEGWWDNDKAEEWDKLTLEEDLHQIDQQNTQIGQIEPNSTDQNPPLTESDHFGQIEPNSTYQNPPLTESDHFGQIEPNSTYQNPPLTESDHSANSKNAEEQNEVSSNENIAEDERKRKTVAKFHAMRNEFKQKGKYSKKEWNQIEKEIAENLQVNRSKIYKWKKEFGLSRKVLFLIQNSFTAPKHIHSYSEQIEVMKLYYEIKDKNPKISDKDIAMMLNIGSATLFKWKKQIERQQLHSNSVGVHSLKENAAANVQEIENSNS